MIFLLLSCLVWFPDVAVERQASLLMDAYATHQTARGAARPCVVDLALQRRAQDCARQLAERGVLTTSLPQLKDATVNLGMGYKTGTDVIRGWAHAYPGCAKILHGNHARVGIGVAEDVRGTLYWVALYEPAPTP